MNADGAEDFFFNPTHKPTWSELFMMLPSQMNKVRVNDVDLHYADIGRGDAVLLIHGGGATDYRTWTPLIDRFAEHYRVVVPSLRYHYPNVWVGDGLDYTPETHAKDVAALIKTLGLAPAHIAGSSMGADISGDWTRGIRPASRCHATKDAGQHEAADAP
jgi:hypothetical protein